MSAPAPASTLGAALPPSMTNLGVVYFGNDWFAENRTEFIYNSKAFTAKWKHSLGLEGKRRTCLVSP